MVMIFKADSGSGAGLGGATTDSTVTMFVRLAASDHKSGDRSR